MVNWSSLQVRAMLARIVQIPRQIHCDPKQRKEYEALEELSSCVDSGLIWIEHQVEEVGE